MQPAIPVQPAPLSGLMRINSNTKNVKSLNRWYEKWKDTKILVRGGSGFCWNEIMNCSEENGLFCIFGLAKYSRLTERIRKEMREDKFLFKNQKSCTGIQKLFIPDIEQLADTKKSHQKGGASGKRWEPEVCCYQYYRKSGAEIVWKGLLCKRRNGKQIKRSDVMRLL